MEIKLLTRKYKGIFVSIGKFGTAIYIHLPKSSMRFYWSRWGFKFSRWSTVDFNRLIEIGGYDAGKDGES